MRHKLSPILGYLILIGFSAFHAVFASANKNGTSSSSGGSTVSSQIEKEFADWAGRQFASRMVWMTHQRRFVLPKGTILQVTPKITVPVFRHAPYDGGFDSDIQASWTFYMKFDKLNMTSDDHPWPFDRPPFYPFGDMMRPNVGPPKKADGENGHKNPEKVSLFPNNFHSNPYGGEHKPFPNIHYTSDEGKSLPLHTIREKNVYPAFKGHLGQGQGQRLHRRPRAIMSLPPATSIFGGERANIFPSLEGLMTSVGLEGRACLLRAVCEVHEFPLGAGGGYGLFGELVTLFFSISESSYAESHMPEYLKAEEMGKVSRDCSKYKKNCNKSIFVWEPRPGFTFKEEGSVPEVEKVKDNAI